MRHRYQFTVGVNWWKMRDSYRIHRERKLVTVPHFPKLYKADPAADAKAAERVSKSFTYDELDEAQKKLVDQAMLQLEQAPAEMLPMIIQQIEQQIPMAAEEELAPMLYLRDELKKRLSDG